MIPIKDIWSFRRRMYEIAEQFILGSSKRYRVILFNDFVFTIEPRNLKVEHVVELSTIMQTDDYIEYFKVIQRLAEEWELLHYIEVELL